MSLIYSHCISLLLLSMMPSKRVILEQICVFQRKKKVNRRRNNMLRRPHKKTFLWLATIRTGAHCWGCVKWNVHRCSWPVFDVDGWLNFFSPSRPFPATTGGRARTRRDLLRSVSGKGTAYVTSITPRGRRCTQTLSSLVVKLLWIYMDLWSLGDWAQQLAAQLFQVQKLVSFLPLLFAW